MVPTYSSDELVSRLPGALARLSDLAEYDIERMRAIAGEEGVEHFPRPKLDDQRSLRLRHSEDAASLNRRLRTAISKVIGQPTGTDKAYSSGPFIFEVRVKDDLVVVSARPQRSLESIGAAAVAWMSGMPFAEWSDAEGSGIMHPTERMLRAPSVHERPGGLSFALDLASGLHPAGAVANDLPQRREALITYFSGLVGEPEVPSFITQRQAWLRGERQLRLEGFRGGGNHSLTFVHDDSGAIAW